LVIYQEPLTVVCPHAARDPVRKNGCDSLPLKVWRHLI